MKKGKIIMWIITLLFAVILLSNNLYFAAQEPVVISLVDGKPSTVYNTTLVKINTYDFLCQYDEEITGIPMDVTLRAGGIADEIIFLDNYKIETTQAERFNWEDYKGKVIKIRVSCYGYISNVQIV